MHVYISTYILNIIFLMSMYSNILFRIRSEILRGGELSQINPYLTALITSG